LVVLVDSKEPKNYVDKLRNEGLPVEVRDILFCDYIVTVNNYSIGIERKTAEDFVASIIDGRIFNQAYMLSTMFPVSYIIVEGFISEALSYTAFSRRAYIGALVSLALKTSPHGQRGRISIINVELDVDTVLFIKYLHKKLEEGDFERLPRVRLPKKSIIDRKGVMIAMLQVIPGVGEERAKKIAGAYNSVAELLTTTPDKLAMIDGISYNLAKKILYYLGAET